MKRTGRKDTYYGWNEDTSILMLSGRDDSVDDSDKGMLSVKNKISILFIYFVQLYSLSHHQY